MTWYQAIDSPQRISQRERSTNLIKERPRTLLKIAFRDALRANPILVARYAALKRALVSKHADDREAYSTAKADFVESAPNCRQQRG